MARTNEQHRERARVKLNTLHGKIEDAIARLDKLTSTLDGARARVEAAVSTCAEASAMRKGIFDELHKMRAELAPLRDEVESA